MLAVVVALHLTVQVVQVVLVVVAQVAQIIQQLRQFQVLHKLVAVVVAQKEMALLQVDQVVQVLLLFATQIHYLLHPPRQALLQLPLLVGIVFINGLFQAQLRFKVNYESFCKSRKWNCYASNFSRTRCN
jgi:hypothetical protein